MTNPTCTLHSGCAAMSPQPPASPPCNHQPPTPQPYLLRCPPQNRPLHKHPQAQPRQLRAAPVRPCPKVNHLLSGVRCHLALPPSEGISSPYLHTEADALGRGPWPWLFQIPAQSQGILRGPWNRRPQGAGKTGTRAVGAPGAVARGGGARLAPGSTRQALHPLHTGLSPAELAPGHKACCSGNPLNGFWTHKGGSV